MMKNIRNYFLKTTDKLHHNSFKNLMTAIKIEVPISTYTVNGDDELGNFGFKF